MHSSPVYLYILLLYFSSSILIPIPRYSCRVVLHDNAVRLNVCLARRGVHKITVQGTSIAKFTMNYLAQRLLAIGWTCGDPKLEMSCYAPNWGKESQTKEPSVPFISAVLTTLGSPHLLWRDSREEWTAKVASAWNQLKGVESVPPVPANRSGRGERARRGFTMKRVVAWGFGPFIASEREPHITVTRMIELGAVARDMLTGWREIDWHGPSAAFAFDSATQGDGLHIIGPPMKLFVELFLGSLCEDEAGVSTF